MQKIIKYYGSSLVITFTREEQEMYGIDEGKVFEVTLKDTGKKVKPREVEK